jgi:hypothetical protein
MLCTKQYSFHCASTFARPRSVNRSSPLVVAHIAEHRLDGGEAARVLGTAVVGVDALSHLLGVRDTVHRATTAKGDLAHRCRVWRAQTLRAKYARRAIAFRTAKLFVHVAIHHARLAFAIEEVSRRTHARARGRIIRKRRRGKARSRMPIYHLVVQRMWRRFVSRLRRKSRIPFPHLLIRNQRGD